MLSNQICQTCNNDLEIFSQFRKDLTLKQNALYAQLKQSQPSLASKIFNDVKLEINELFVDCNPDAEEDDVFHPQIIIKSEVEDIEALEPELLNESLDWDEPLEEIKSMWDNSYRFQWNFIHHFASI